MQSIFCTVNRNISVRDLGNEALFNMSMKRITPVKKDWITFAKKRLEELGLSIAEAERQWGLPKDTIQKMLLGSGTDYEKFLVIKERLRYNIPLYGKLISGKGVQMLGSNKEESRISLHESVEYSPDLQAIIVEDDRYEPRLIKGDVIYFKQTANNIPATLNSKRPYVVKIKDSEPDVMIIRPGTRPGFYNLLAIDGTANLLVDCELEWCAPIEDVKWEYS